MGKEDVDISDVSDRIFVVLMIFALATMLIGAIGFCFYCVKNRCLAFVYGLILLPTWIAVIVIGAIAVAASALSEKHLTDTCNKIANDISYTYSTNTAGTTHEVKYSLDFYESIGINRYMCTNDCICEPNAATTYANIDWSFWPDDANRGPIITGANSVATYKDCIANAGAPASTADVFKTFA